MWSIHSCKHNLWIHWRAHVTRKASSGLLPSCIYILLFISGPQHVPLQVKTCLIATEMMLLWMHLFQNNSSLSNYSKQLHCSLFSPSCSYSSSFWCMWNMSVSLANVQFSSSHTSNICTSCCTFLNTSVNLNSNNHEGGVGYLGKKKREKIQRNGTRKTKKGQPCFILQPLDWECCKTLLPCVY